ncbi:MAG: glutamyl-tRNA amidotransferase [Bacteroidetes bacterium RIFOXYA12_FULL_35_11]|nr:MAG: glutamyl-tRNA amidotransferase [Bacteroidetes bacterium GWF2_35_48]OFY79249.1 MAG: glutamyl-tRNA amidotransferase [Bacteroidetes bacterium RIFOXYA12_FULL_35_11]OFY96242.1 MAG: glutamyl-tRNA amidotransferase [Bacteroidetes bacterium RIFOXYB2_FULL_35_7]OFY96441.1 MAG: glutamyl-tRNA amidotransferase [Bacteroidetes bacterium RIFOXYC12_FULL_35_7]HBX50508.1 glutamyl-tRNA amidotransferase [Bacteroidales bacterium]
MALEEKINNDIKAAMLARDQAKLLALRAVKAEIIMAKTSGAGNIITSDTELKILQKLVKQRKEAALVYKQQGREDLYTQEEFEASVIEAYLPKQMSEEEIITDLKKIIAETGATSVKEMGKVMGIASKHFAGKADNKIVSDKIKELLGS